MKTRSHGQVAPFLRRSKRIDQADLELQRDAARKHGVGGGGPRLMLYEQFPGVEGVRLWPNVGARAKQRIAYFKIVAKFATREEYAAWRESRGGGRVEALQLRCGWWAYDVDASPAYLINTGTPANCRIMDCSVCAPNAAKVWVAAGSHSIARGAPLLVGYGRHSTHHAKIREEKAAAAPQGRTREPRVLSAGRGAAKDRKRRMASQLARARQARRL